VVIHNAVIYDGSGEKPYPGEVAIDGDRIAYVGPPSALKGRSEINANGQAVSPGFIDMMGHSEESLLIDGRAVSGLLRGRAWTGASGGGCRASAKDWTWVDQPPGP
jgi:N-acyl-D-amino-acid deacylase